MVSFEQVCRQATIETMGVGTVFSNASGLLLSHSGVKVLSFTRNMTLASGTQAVTGVGFKPVAAIFFAIRDSTSEASWGLDDFTTHLVLADGHTLTADTFIQRTDESILLIQGGGNGYRGHVSSWDADGCTITWTQENVAKTGTATILALFFR